MRTNGESLSGSDANSASSAAMSVEHVVPTQVIRHAKHAMRNLSSSSGDGSSYSSSDGPMRVATTTAATKKKKVKKSGAKARKPAEKRRPKAKCANKEGGCNKWARREVGKLNKEEWGRHCVACMCPAERAAYQEYQ